MAITRSKGLKPRPQKVAIYGPEGVGKSTLGAALPAPVFIDAEGGTDQLDVERFSVENMKDFWEAVKTIVSEGTFKTIVIDTADWFEQLVVNEICQEFKVDSITDEQVFGFGKGAVLMEERMMRVLQRLDSYRSSGNVHIVFLAHSKVQKREDPELASSYDRYVLKMGKKSSAVVMEWADAVLFYNFDTRTTEREKKGSKSRGVGGKKRLLHVEHTAAYDAKHRHGFTKSIEVDIDNPAAGLEPIFSIATGPATAPVEPAKKTATTARPTPAASSDGDLGSMGELSEIVAECGQDEFDAFIAHRGLDVSKDAHLKRIIGHRAAFVAGVKKFSQEGGA